MPTSPQLDQAVAPFCTSMGKLRLAVLLIYLLLEPCQKLAFTRPMLSEKVGQRIIGRKN